MSVLGACVGDAAGAVLEFMGRAPTAEEVEKALTFPGGGRGHVGPGQVTDDSELAMVLWSALKDRKPCYGPSTYNAARAYGRWYESEPFDVGMTCSQAFEAVQELLDGSEGDYSNYKAYVRFKNYDSEANGALMRCTPLAAWAAASGESASAVALFGELDAQLSHPNEVCLDCNALYLYAATLLLRGGKPADVYEKTCEFAEERIAELKKKNGYTPTRSVKVLNWLLDESKDLDALNCRENIGHVKWGFCLAFYFLQHPEISYEEALRITLLKGGDTDTNAAIVGGLVGCYQPVPAAWQRAVLDFRADGSRGGHVRPEWVWPRTYLDGKN